VTDLLEVDCIIFTSLKLITQAELPRTVAAPDPDRESLTDFLLVEDIFRFENMGFSHTEENRK
jgi:hypothetical protein